MPEEILQKILALREELHQHNYNYYVLDEPTITDFEFDEKLSELKALERKYPQFYDASSPTERVGGSITKVFPTIAHEKRMYSLDNSYNFADLKDWETRVTKALGQPVEYVVELKYDGASISILYENNRLIKAVTRGDGFQGDEVTGNVKTIQDIPLQIPRSTSQRFFMRGEIFLSKKNFERLNKAREEEGLDLFMNPRNTASGTLKLQDSAEVKKRKLSAVLYQVVSDNLEHSTHWETLEAAQEWGFKTSAFSQLCSSLEQVEQYISYWEEKRHTLDFEIDGIVVKINRLDQQAKLGYTAKSPRWAIAYKFKAEKAISQLLSVSYQVGRTGAITPVANLSPVLLAGTIVKRASLHNQDIMNKLDLHEQDFVYVEKGGEIIPKIVGVDTSKRKPATQKIEFISHCPECQAPLFKIPEQAIHYCPNEDHCPPQVIGKLYHYVSRKALNIENIGQETIELLYNAQLVENPADFYALTKEQLVTLDRMADKSATNIIEGINKSKQIPFEKVLFGLGIKHVGETVAKKIVRKYPTIDLIQSAKVEDFTAIDDVGEKIARSIWNYFQKPEHLLLIERLRNYGVQLEQHQAPNRLQSTILSGKSFLFTGKLTLFTREQAQLMVEEHGGTNASGVSKNLHYLVAGEKAGSKLKKALALGTVLVIDENEFLKLLED